MIRGSNREMEGYTVLLFQTPHGHLYRTAKRTSDSLDNAVVFYRGSDGKCKEVTVAEETNQYGTYTLLEELPETHLVGVTKTSLPIPKTTGCECQTTSFFMSFDGPVGDKIKDSYLAMAISTPKFFGRCVQLNMLSGSICFAPQDSKIHIVGCKDYSALLRELRMVLRDPEKDLEQYWAGSGLFLLRRYLGRYVMPGHLAYLQNRLQSSYSPEEIMFTIRIDNLCNQINFHYLQPQKTLNMHPSIQTIIVTVTNAGFCMLSFKFQKDEPWTPELKQTVTEQSQRVFDHVLTHC